MYFSAFLIFGLIGAALLIAGDAYRLHRFSWAAPVMIAFLLLSEPCLKLLPSISYDHVLLVADYRLGYHFELARFLSAPVPITMIHLLYSMLPLAIAFVYAVLDDAARKPFGIAMLLAGVAAPFFYAICTAAGPAYVYGDAFPLHPPALKAALPFSAPGLIMNAVPSGHFAWAMLLWWHTRRQIRGIRIVAGLFLAGTAVSTLATGEHYLIDLVVAVPFAVAVDAAVGRRWIPAAANTAVVVVWLLVLREGLVGAVPSLVVVPLAALTVAAPLVLCARTSASPGAAQAKKRAS